ncbi:MAG: T9SS type A sorting domain-containing protein [Lewinellaceae bacterium]|nr:T9SS type A sorting domain-containing protein [Lewinellaceae bacterium]
MDQDGFQSPSEKGVPGITVKLTEAGQDSIFGTPDDILVATVLTDSTGKYGFACVAPGRYIVQFSGIPTGYEFTAKNVVNNTCKDSDANPNGSTAPIIITAGQSDNLCVDAGIHIICENVTKAGILCCNQTICEGETPNLLYGNPLFPPQGGSGKLEYLWMQLIQSNQGPPTWAPIPGATNSSYQPGPLFETAYFLRCVRRENCLNFLESNMLTITVKPAGTPGCPSFFSVFNATPMSNAAVKLEWRTLPEMTRYWYIAERSMDNQTWSSIGEIPGHENASEPNEYSLMDRMPGNGMNYYRVRRISPAGVVSMSDVREIMLDISRDESLAVYPNPVAQVLHIRNLIAYEADAQVQLFAANGVLLHTLKIPVGSLEHFAVPVADLLPGIYLVRIRFGDGQSKTLKVSKF